MAASANMFYIAIGYKNRANMKVAASNIKIKIFQLFSEQWVLGIRVTTAQRKIFVDLNNVQTILVKITIILTFLSNSFFNSFMIIKNEKRTVFRFPFFYEKNNE